MDSTDIPSHLPKEKLSPDNVFLRTVIKQEVYDKLKLIAQHYCTGRGDWDFGVAIQILVEHHEESKLSLQNEKLDMILHLLDDSSTTQEKQEEDPFIEMLGGSKITLK